MAAGCAILASDLPAIHEIVDTQTAAFFEAGQPDSLKAGLLALMQDFPACAALGQQAYAKVGDYTWARRAERQLAFIESLRQGT
jgi:glycosyltransferase involved in cell wall biosynthesis